MAPPRSVNHVEQEDGWTCSEEGALQELSIQGHRRKKSFITVTCNAHVSRVLDPAGSRLFSKLDGLEKHEACMPCL